MNFRKAQREEPVINLTPLIDVVFLLLIFFMVSTTFKKEAEITVDLPEASTEPQEQKERDEIEIMINSDGQFAINGRRLVNAQRKTLGRALEQVIAQFPDKSAVIVTISADGRTPHQSVVTAMDVARDQGLLHISLATKPVQE